MRYRICKLMTKEPDSSETSVCFTLWVINCEDRTWDYISTFMTEREAMEFAEEHNTACCSYPKTFTLGE